LPDSKEEAELMNASQSLHPTDHALRAYGLGNLDAAAAESIDNHLESCSDCQRRVAELSSDRFLERLRKAQVPPVSPGPITSSTTRRSMLDTGAAGSARPPPARTLPPGLADHPDYEITRELGRGGMGVVYLAQNKLMGRTEVLKVVGSHLINRSGVADRFLAEIRNAARLHHPNIVTAYAALRIGESLVLAMQYVEGLDLAKVVQGRGSLPVAQACNYVHQAALGLQHAHEHGMVHRDIKPSNLMLTRDGNRALIKVLDFGLAKVESEGAVDGGLTREGQMLGTPDYIAPEQIIDSRRADIRADVYSLGCTLYHLLTGGPPFRGTSLFDILEAHHSMEAMQLNLARPEVPLELAALVAKMMAKEPKRRFQEPKEVAFALTRFFKKGNPAFQSAETEVSHGGQLCSGLPVTGVALAPTQSLTNDAGPIAQQQSVAMPSARETKWQPPIDLREPDRTRAGTPAIARTWGPPWLGPSVIVGVLMLGLIAAWLGGVFKVKTRDGVIVLENVPEENTPQARGSEDPKPTTEIVSSRADVTGGVPTNAVETFARTPVDKPPTPHAALPLDLAKKTSISLTRIVHVDEFNGPQHGLLKDLNIPHDPNHGRSDGVFFVYSPGGWSAWNLHAIRSEGTCEVIARVLSENPSKTAAWTVSVVNQVSSERGFFIKINVKGELFLEPSPWPKAAAFRQIDPKRGPITHTAIKPGNEFNKLLLIMRNREVVIFVNGVQVCDPVRFNYDITPSVLAVGVAGPGRKRAEFDRLEIREMMRPKDTLQR
jgi:serine/threonine protein kinase